MSEREQGYNPEKEQKKIPEYNYDKGLEKALELIKTKFKDQDTVVSGIVGAGANVGKTTLSRDIIEGVYKQMDDIEIVSSNNADDGYIKSKSKEVKDSEKQKLVLIGQASLSTPDKEDLELNKESVRQTSFGPIFRFDNFKIAKTLNKGEYDILIGIYNPQEHVPEVKNLKEDVDILIRNEKAKQK